ncbi:MAG: biotin--[acetyl-CoA-carboxylase] ligase [Lachnospiraceae bacterium]|nr:biotin--[acetyl-CoA-carboxylase] ligase [Lachnospiraceae bacterium]
MKAEILTALREAEGYVSGQQLCQRFGVSRTAVWKAINQLKKEGYAIEAVQNRGYRITDTPDILSENELLSIRRTAWVGEKIYYYEATDSTNIRANRLAEEGAPHGTLVVADAQDAGRGRRGRGWDSSSGTSVYMTLLLKPDIDAANASMLTLVAAMAVAEGIRRVSGLNAQIKWPNDIVINGKKVCGILTEMSAQMDYVNHIVIGIGINVHNESFPEDIARTATSLLIESGGEHFHRAQLIEAVWEAFEGYYERYLATQDLRDLRSAYDAGLVNLGERVRVLDPKEPYEGVAQGITDRGELIVDKDGTRTLVSSGEVSVRGIYGYV